MSEFTDFTNSGDYLIDIVPSTDISEGPSADPALKTAAPQDKSHPDMLCDINTKTKGDIDISSLCPLFCKGILAFAEFIKHRSA
ncbi:hypothetical protein [Neorickettsia sennetsu]|nr:hypothetical protein [Neorickettsia sennetsu]